MGLLKKEGMYSLKNMTNIIFIKHIEYTKYSI